MVKQQKHTFLSSALFPMVFALLMWVVFYYDNKYSLGVYRLGVQPRKLTGLIGTLFMPLLHGDFNHILSNTFPLLILGTLLFYFYKDIAYKVFFIIYLFSGLLVWVGGNIEHLHRESFHIGASAIIYGLSGFLFFSGIIRKHKALFGVSLLVTFMYGTIIWGVFPVAFQKAMHILREKENISWEGHLFGFMSGVILAYVYRKTGIQEPQYSWDITNDKEIDESNPYWMVDEEGNPLNENIPPIQSQKKDESNNAFRSESSDPLKITYTFVPKNNDEGRDKMG